MTLRSIQKHFSMIPSLEATPSVEGVSTDGVEREYVFFGKMDDPDELIKATSWEDQEQWRIKVPCDEKGREIAVRIRRTVRMERETHASDDSGIKVSDPVYTLTIKSFMKGEQGNVESEVVMEASEGEPMLRIFRANGDGMIKRRYFFPLDAESSKKLGFDKEVFDETTACWEVDVFWTGRRIRQRNQDDVPGYNANRFHP